jgi:hypothetical protein
VAPPKPETKPIVAPPAAPAPPAPAAPIRLNIHKPEKEAPGNVTPLPFAPAVSAAGSKTPTPSGEPDLGGSRLSGLNPYPAGSMPGGGTGLRGTLVGCANSDAVSLSATERARCNERFGSAARSAPVFDSMSPAKRAQFDKAVADEDTKRAYRAAVPTGTTPSSHPGFGAGLGPDQPTTIGTLLASPK